MNHFSISFLPNSKITGLPCGHSKTFLLSIKFCNNIAISFSLSLSPPLTADLHAFLVKVSLMKEIGFFNNEFKSLKTESKKSFKFMSDSIYTKILPIIKNRDDKRLYLNMSSKYICDKDLHTLRDVHTLYIYGCDKITDLVPLAGVKRLGLVYCQNIKDVSVLGNVHTLSIEGCDNITDISGLNNVYNLNLCRSQNIVDTHIVWNNHTLNISHTTIGDAELCKSDFSNVHTLYLDTCVYITNKCIYRLANTHTLSISNTFITNVEALGNVHTLNLGGLCSLITDEGIDRLGSVYSLNLSHCSKITGKGISTLANVYDLDLSYCGNIKYLSNCLSILVNIHTLKIRHCNNLTDIHLSAFKNVHTLDISGCDLITKKGIKWLINVHTLDISGCNRLRYRDLHILKNVVNLKHRLKRDIYDF